MTRFVGTVAGLMIGLHPTLAAQSPSSPASRAGEIAANGRGDVRLAPDYAYVTLGVTTNSRNAVETASQNAARLSAIISALRALGLTEQQVTTTGYNLTQVYEYPKNQQPRVSGFAARNSIRADVRRLADLGKVIDAAINAGATDVSSILFLSSGADEARRTALTDAVKQARSDAETMARAAGGSLGRLIAVNTAGVSQPIAIRGAALESVVVTGAGGYAGAPMPPTPISPGDINVSAVVFMRWEFTPGGGR